MGVPMDRGLTHASRIALISFVSVEMGVPMDRGLAHPPALAISYAISAVEMGVPMDRGLTQKEYGEFFYFFMFRRNGCPDG